MFLLDTNVISELRKAKPHGAVSAWYASQPPKSFFLPSVALYELQAGVELTRAQDSIKAQQIERWIDGVVSSAIVLNLDANAARMTARLMHRKSLELFEDAMIAAIAKVNGLTVATRNIRDFKLFEVAVVDPFTYLTR